MYLRWLKLNSGSDPCLKIGNRLTKDRFKPFLLFFIDFWSNLAPKLGSKIHQESIQEPSKIHSKLYLVFDTCLDRFLIDFGSNLGPSNPSKTLRNQMFFNVFVFFVDCLLDCFWKPTWLGFGRVWEPSWSQKSIKNQFNKVLKTR